MGFHKSHFSWLEMLNKILHNYSLHRTTTDLPSSLLIHSVSFPSLYLPSKTQDQYKYKCDGTEKTQTCERFTWLPFFTWSILTRVTGKGWYTL